MPRRGTTASTSSSLASVQRRSLASSATRNCRSRAAGLSAQALEWMTRRRTTSGWSAARCWTMDPPVETPITSTGPPNSWRMVVATSVAMSAIE